MTYRIAIAGLGQSLRHIHLPAYQRIPALEVVGGYDPVTRQDAFPFPLFTSVPEMLERTKPHVFTVATPPDSHFELTRLGLQAGCHVFCEKPFMNSLAEADATIALSREVGRHVVVNNQFRFMRIHQAARKKIGAHDFGNLLFLTMHQTFFVTERTEAGWRGQDLRRTGKDFGTHALDLCRYFFGEEPLSISARMPKGARPDGPDYLNLIQLEFSGDRIAHITLDRLSCGRHRYLNIRLDGEIGCIETSLGGRLETSVGIRAATRRPFVNFDWALGGRARLYNGERFSTLARDPLNVFGSATAELMKAFLGALDRGEVPPCNAADNRPTLALMLAAYDSAEKRMPIALR
jgi:predicted dehydrogenase